MAKRIIELTVSDEYVIGGGVPIGAAGSHDDVVLRMSFSDEWMVRNKYATFRDALGENPTIVALLPSMLVSGKDATYDVVVPSAAKKIDGRASMTLTGYTVVNGSEEDEASNTAVTYFRVLPSTYKIMDDDSIDATLAQQLHVEIEELSHLIAELSKRVDELEAGR